MKKNDCLVCAGMGILLLGVILFTFIIVQVGGMSMEPTFQNGSFLIAKRGTDINRNDIVLIKTAENNLIVKRVIAMAGDNVTATGDAVYVNRILIDTFQNCKDGNFSVYSGSQCRCLRPRR